MRFIEGIVGLIFLVTTLVNYNKIESPIVLVFLLIISLLLILSAFLKTGQTATSDLLISDKKLARGLGKFGKFLLISIIVFLCLAFFLAIRNPRLKASQKTCFISTF